MFLFCLLAAYFITRLWEDTSARLRGQPPPRHEYRMAKLAARERNGGRVPQSPMGRYLTGLFDDAWDSAHHKRQLLAEHRKQKREDRAARKIERYNKRQQRKASKRADAGQNTAPLGFDVEAPQAAQLPTEPGGTPAPASAAAAAPAAGEGRPSAPEVGSEQQIPASGAQAEPPRPAPVGFDVQAPQVPVIEEGPLHRTAGPGAPGHLAATGSRDRLPAPRAATQELAGQLRQRMAAVDGAALAAEACYPLSAAQQATVDSVLDSLRTGKPNLVKQHELRALPVGARADLLDAVRSSADRRVAVVPGHEDVEALALLNERLGGRLDPADVYEHPDDTPPYIRNRLAAEQERSAAALAAERAAAPPLVDPETGFTVPDEASSPCRCGLGMQRPVPGTVEADQGDGGAAVATTCDNPYCSISSGYDWVPTDEEYERYFGHAFGEDTEEPDDELEEDTTPDNVIPFTRIPNHNTVTPTRMELPVPTPTNGTGEVTGLASAITYAQGLAAFCTHTLDQVSAIVPSGQDAATSCEQARENLAAGGVTGPALTDVTNVQEQVTSAVQAIQAALAQLEAAGASARNLEATLTRHQQTVGEAYAASPDAGDRQFVTTE